MSLKDCYGKLGKIISREDQEKVQAIADSLVEQGVSKPKAEQQAVGTLLAEVESNLESIALRAKDNGANVKTRKPEKQAKKDTVVEPETTDLSNAVEQQAFDQIEADFDLAVEQYSDLPDSEGGKVMSADVSKELFDSYNQDRTLAPQVHRPASAFIKRLYREKLQQKPQKGEEAKVLFTAGGAGAGKTTAINNNFSTDGVQIVYDTNMRNLVSGRNKINQALEADKEVMIVMVHRDAVDAFTRGVVPRAVQQEQEFGSGRILTIDDYIATHQGAIETIQQLQEEYKDDPRVDIRVVNNSYGYNNAQEESIDTINDVVYDETVRDALLNELETLYEQGEISQQIYEGIKGEERQVDEGTTKVFEQPETKYQQILRQVPEIQEIERYLSEVEKQQLISTQSAENILSMMERYPSPAEIATVAESGRAKLGWYNNSSRALRHVFGEDTPRFVALLSALSPQTSVESNLENALSIWTAWDKAGRPTSKSKIVKIMEENVQQQPIVQQEAIAEGKAKKSSVLGAWINNSVKALTTTSFDGDFHLSGAKVDSFMRNLWGELDSVTNDAWMGNFANIDQTEFGGKEYPVGKYVGMSVRVRQASEMLGWQPAEVQEAVWSWAKALFEMTESGKQTAVQALRQGKLTHEIISEIPDFSRVLTESRYANILKKGGYGKRLTGLKNIKPQYDHSKLTGSVYKKGSKHLLNSARRLDALRERRRWENARNTLEINLSSAVTFDPENGIYSHLGLRKLADDANNGDERAVTLLHEIAIDSLNELLPVKNKDFKIEFERVKGLYFGTLEPSVQISSNFKNTDLPRILKGIAQFARNYAQDAVYIRGEAEPKTDIGHRYDDGSYNTNVVTFTLKESMPRDSLEAIVKKSKLAGFTIRDGSLQTWFVGDPDSQKDIEDFANGARTAKKLLEGNVSEVDEGVQRFWSYGDEVDGAYYTNRYSDIESNISKAEEKPNKSARRIATHLAGYEVEPAEIPNEITPEQRALQEEIAVAYDNMLLDNMQDPLVQQAYESLANEVLEQFDSLPITVESWEERTSAETKKLQAESETPIAVGNTTDPYAVIAKDKDGKNLKDEKGRLVRVPDSKSMRKDVLLNNHMWIYKTNKDTFGEEGVVYDDHPLLRDSGRTDMNGVPLVYNDLLRAVHDYYAHTMSTASFGEIGEEVAWRNHMLMTKDPLARWALTSETRGQNSWVNFRPEVRDIPKRDRRFADQKADLLPVNFAMIGDETLDSQLDGYERPNKNFNQPMGEDGRRGNIEFTNRETVIRLFQSSDLSTFLHEAGHLFLEIESSMVKRKGVLSDDQKAILKWLEVDSFDAIETTQHEKWARGFERYLREGKSPSFSLMDAFANYSTWLRSIYKSSSELDVQLDDNIRAVMDRMIVSEKEIDDVTFDDNNNELFDTYESAGMTEKEWESLKKQKARAKDKANQTMADQLLNELERETKKWWNAELREQTTVQREKLAELPVYKASIFFRGKANEDFTNKIKTETVKELSEDGTIPTQMLSMVSNEGTVSADDAGQMFGFDDGASFIKAIKTTKPLTKKAKEDAETILKREHGDILNDGSLKQLAEETARNEEKAKYLLLELRILNRKVKKKPDVDRKEMQYRANRLVANTPVMKLTPHRFRRLEIKYAKEAQKAHSEGDVNKAIEAKKKQIANFYLHRESLEAIRKAGIIRRRQATMQRKKYNAKYVDPDYISRLKMFLSAYNFRADRKLPAMNTLVDLVNWVNTQHEANIKRGVDIKLHMLDPKLEEIAEAVTPEQKMAVQLHNYEEMTLAELQGVDAMAQHMVFVGRKISEDAINSRKKKYEQIADSIRTNAKKGTPWKDTFWVRTKKNVREYASSTFMHAHNMTRLLDGWKDGAVTEAIKKPIDEAVADKLMPMQEEISEHIASIYSDHYSKEELRAYNKKKIVVEGFDESFTKWEVISVALNMGTESNKQAMLDAKLKSDQMQFPNGMTDINNILSNMTEKDWRYVQDVWSHINSYWNRISAHEQKMTGISPAKVEGIPVTTKFGTIQGAYYPLAYDSKNARKVAENEAMEVANAQRHGRFYNAKVKAGFTEERVGSGGLPVKLGVNVYHMHMNKVAHLLALGEAVNEVQNVIASQDFRDALTDTDNLEMLASLDAWIKDIATGEIVSSHIVDRSLRKIRTGFSTLAIGWNIGTAMLQPLGITQTYVVLGGKYTRYGLRKYMQNPKKMTQTVQAMSKVMHERAGKFNKDVLDTLDNIEKDPNKPNIIPKGLVRSFFTPIVWTQRMVDVPTWLGAFEKSRDENPDKPEKYHVWQADAVVKRSQSSGIFSDRTSIERGTVGSVTQSEWIRMVTALGGYFFNKANLIQETTSNTDFKKPKEILSYTNKMLALVVWETIAYHMMKGTFPDLEDEPEDIIPFIAEESAYTMLGAFPLIRELSSEAQGFRGGGTLGTFYKTVGDGFKQAKQGEVDKALVRSINDIGGIMFRYPSKAVFRVGDELVKDVNGDDFDLIEYLMWREKD